MNSDYYIRNNCRLCGVNEQNLVLPLEPTALCDAFIKHEKLDIKQPVFPLDLFQCNKCGHTQISCIVEPETIYKDYIYVSSSSLDLSDHFKIYADSVRKKLKPSENTLIVDIGSNDGILLKNFKNKGIRVLGIEPSKEIAKEAKINGVDTIPAYFSSNLSQEIISDYGYADIVTVNNLFANIDNLEDFVMGIKKILSKDGVLIIEASYLLDLIQNMVFDYIYHEHLSYFSIKPLKIFFNNLGMDIFDVEKIGTKGGSIRIFIQYADGPHSINETVSQMITNENDLGLYNSTIWKKFNDKINDRKTLITNKLIELKDKGCTIAGYGGSATSTTLIYHFGLNNFISYIFDDNVAKHNTYSPGFHIPVFPSSLIYDKTPDYIVLLAWRFKQPIVEKHKEYLNNNGNFILPLPDFKII